MRVGTADPRKGGWSKIDSIGAQKFIVHEDSLLSIGNRSTAVDSGFRGAYIYKWDNASIVGSTVNVPTYRMSAIRGKKPHIYHDKDFRFINIYAAGLGTLTVTIKVDGVDYDTGTTVQTESIALTSAGAKTKIALTSQATGKTLWIQFAGGTSATSGGLLDLSITKVQVFYNLRGLRNA
jgi:hypothetical protein